MRSILSIGLLTALVALGCGSSPALGAETLTGKVVGVTDGDTITALVDRHPIKV